MQKQFLKDKAKTGKEWAWFFYQELGYRIVEDEENERVLKKAMNKVLEDAEKFVEHHKKCHDTVLNKFTELGKEHILLKQKLQRVRNWIKKKRKELDFQEKNTARSSISIDDDRKELNGIEELLK